MNFLPTKNWEDIRQRVLVKSEVDLAKEWKLPFEVASVLRRAGYIVELDQGYTRATDYQWILRIQHEEKPPFLLTNQVRGESIGADSLNAILNTLQETKINEAGSP